MSGGAGKAIFRKKQASPEDGFRNNYYSGPTCNSHQGERRKVEDISLPSLGPGKNQKW
jgi:hypothetical protein